MIKLTSRSAMTSLKLVLLFTSTTVLTHCGAPQAAAPSHTEQRFDISSASIDPASATAFIQKLHDIAAAGRGSVSISDLMSILPLDQAGRNSIGTAFARPLNVTCANSRCRITGQGRAVEALLNVNVGTISQPLLGLRTSLQGDYVLRGEDGIELCAIRGIYIRKSVVSRNVQGMLMKANNGSPTLNVNLAGSEDYTCN